MRIFLLIVMLLAQPSLAAESSQNLSTFFDSAPAASANRSPAKTELPDLSKAPKWHEVVAKPEFQALTAEQKITAKAAYFDHWIAPHAAADGMNVAEVRAEFLKFDVAGARKEGYSDAEKQALHVRHINELIARHGGADVRFFNGMPERTWDEFAWPHYIVLGVLVLGIGWFIRANRPGKPFPNPRPNPIPSSTAARAGGSRVNDRQRTILIVAGVLVGLMMLYPPFQHHTGAGMGYSWLFSPPEDHATINASQLLVQWVAVLLIGGIAFVLSGQTGIVAPGAPSTVAAPALEPVVGRPEVTFTPGLTALYAAVIGDRNRNYYLARFATFDQSPSGLRPSWNWAAFLGGGLWALYRKMYGWIFAFWALDLVAAFFVKLAELKPPGAGDSFAMLAITVLLVPWWFAFGIYANALYHRKVKKKIAAAESTITDGARLLDHLKRKGGVHFWPVLIFLLLPIIGIVAAVVIPMLARQ